MKLRASASRAFRVPGYTDLYYHDPANLGSPGLRPERAWTYESGIDWIPAARVRGELTVFHRRERDGIDYYRSGPNDIWRALNIQNLNFTGVEARPPRCARFDFRYTGLRGAQDTIAAGFTKYTFNYPTHSGVVSWQGTLPGGLIGRTRIGVLDRRARDPYAVWDLYAARSTRQAPPLPAGLERHQHALPGSHRSAHARPHDRRRPRTSQVAPALGIGRLRLPKKDLPPFG